MLQLAATAPGRIPSSPTPWAVPPPRGLPPSPAARCGAHPAAAHGGVVVQLVQRGAVQTRTPGPGTGSRARRALAALAAVPCCQYTCARVHVSCVCMRLDTCGTLVADTNTRTLLWLPKSPRRTPASAPQPLPTRLTSTLPCPPPLPHSPDAPVPYPRGEARSAVGGAVRSTS